MNLLTKIIKYIKFRNFNVVQADHSDLDFIVNSLIDNAKDGHCYAGIDIDDQFVNDIYEIAKNSIDGYITTTYIDNKFKNLAQLYFLYKNKENQNIGFAIIKETFEKSFEIELEIYMFGVIPLYRKNGHGRNFLKLLMSLFSNETKLVARCYAKSNVMKFILEDAGFKVVHVSKGGISHLVLSGRQI